MTMSPVNYNVVPAVVSKNDDPDKLGRIKVRYPWMGDKEETDWIPIVAPAAGNKRGMFSVPEEKDQVLVAFSYGEPDKGYVLGSLWSTEDKPPADGDRNKRVIKSVSGHTITLDDTKDKETITIVDKSEKNSIELDAKNNTITIKCGGDLTITADGKIEIKSSKDVSIKGQNVTIEADQKVAAKGVEMALNGTSGVKVNDGALEVI